MPTVHQATWEMLHALGVRKVFGNPGSTEMPFLADFPDDIDYVLGLHEGAVVGMADVYAQLTGEPTLVNLHTAVGLGNAMGAIINAASGHSPGSRSQQQLPEPALRKQATHPVPLTIGKEMHPDVVGKIHIIHIEIAIRRIPTGNNNAAGIPISSGGLRRRIRNFVITAIGIAPDMYQVQPVTDLMRRRPAPVIRRGSRTLCSKSSITNNHPVRFL